MPLLPIEAIRRNFNFNDKSAAIQKDEPGYDRRVKLGPPERI